MTIVSYAGLEAMCLGLGRPGADLVELFGSGGQMIGWVGPDEIVHYLFTINRDRSGENVSVRVWKLDSCNDCSLPDVTSPDFLKWIFNNLDLQDLPAPDKGSRFVILNSHLKKVDFYRLFGPDWNFCLVTRDDELAASVNWRFCRNTPYLIVPGENDAEDCNRDLRSLPLNDPTRLLAYLKERYPSLRIYYDASLDETAPGR